MAKLVVEIQGGLGNQLFQFANAFRINHAFNFQHQIVLSERLIKLQGKNPRFTARSVELSPLNYDFGQLSFAEKKLVSIAGSPHGRKLFESTYSPVAKFLPGQISENRMPDDLFFDEHRKLVLLTGFWQDAVNYIPLKDQITRIVESVHPKFLSPRFSILSGEIENSNSLCIHFRRSDYVSNPKARNFHGLLGKEFFLSAYNTAIQNSNIEKVFIFTEDRQILAGAFDFIEGNNFQVIDAGDNLSSWENLLLMSKSANMILSNSSFSWWSAFINRRAEKSHVYGPSKWFRKGDKSLMLPSWKAIPSYFE
jgi:hypothetical protein